MDYIKHMQRIEDENAKAWLTNEIYKRLPKRRFLCDCVDDLPDSTFDKERQWLSLRLSTVFRGTPAARLFEQVGYRELASNFLKEETRVKARMMLLASLMDGMSLDDICKRLHKELVVNTSRKKVLRRNTFDLEKALTGESVRLRNGRRAWVVCDKRVLINFSGISLPLIVNDCIYTYFMTPEGTTGGTGDKDNPNDIVGMWEEIPDLPIDHPILVANESTHRDWLMMHFSGFNPGESGVTVWSDGRTSLSSSKNVTFYEHVKLPTPEALAGTLWEGSPFVESRKTDGDVNSNSTSQREI